MRCANWLLGAGLRKNQCVGVLLENRQEYLELHYATSWTGIWIVPINIRLSPGEMAFWLNDSASRMLVVDKRFAPVVDELRPKLTSVEKVVFVGSEADCPGGMESYDASLSNAACLPPGLDEPAEDDVAGLFYTSGTTGGPKGVMLTHRNLYANALHVIAACGAASSWIHLHAAPMFHAADGTATYYLSLVGGAHAFLPVFEPEFFLKAVARHRITTTILVPTMINALMNHPSLGKADIASLTDILYGASPMPESVMRRAIEHFGCIFTQAYGMTECSPIATILAKQDHVLNTRKVNSCGRAVLGVDLQITDFDGSPLPPGKPGEIVLRGPNVMKGYWNRPDITATTLRGGWLHTGDVGTFDGDGYVYLLDRVKDMIKTGGENVYTPEVEAAIFAHPEVAEVAIIGVPDLKWGEAIKAFVVRRPDSAISDTEVIDWCRQRLTHFKCPSSVEFLPALPKGGTGKVLKKVLREPYWRNRDQQIS